jgi:hypothetical protein
MIFRYTGRQWVLLLVGSILSVVGIGVGIPFCWGLPSDIAISLNRREVTGQVLRNERASYTVNDESPTVVRYRYEYGGRSYESSSDVFSGAPPTLAEAGAGTVTVELAAFHPTYSRIAGTRNSLFGAFALLAFVLPLAGGLLLFFAIRSNRRETRAFVDGVPALARVVSVGEDRSTMINGKHPLVMSWEFRVDGEVYEGSLSSMRHLDLEQFLDAKDIVVLYDPEQPQINTIYIAG